RCITRLPLRGRRFIPLVQDDRVWEGASVLLQIYRCQYALINNNTMKKHLYHTYILTNPSRASLYTGVTNNMAERLVKHRLEAAAYNRKKYTGRYNCIH